MAAIRIQHPDDPRLMPYRALPLRAGQPGDDTLIAEGELLVRRLLGSRLQTLSVLVSEKRLARIEPHVPADVPLYVAPNAMMQAIVGFAFHAGIIACGRRPPSPPIASLVGERCLLAVCPKVINTVNVGAIMRIAAAFEADGLLLGETCCDPFTRIALRASMGAAFTLPIVRSAHLLDDLRELRQRKVQLIAAVTDDDAQPLPDAKRVERCALLFGPEDHGLDDATLSLCDRRVTIPIGAATDSLNIASAASIMMYHFGQRG